MLATGDGDLLDEDPSGAAGQSSPIPGQPGSSSAPPPWNASPPGRIPLQVGIRMPGLIHELKNHPLKTAYNAIPESTDLAGDAAVLWCLVHSAHNNGGSLAWSR